MRTEIRGEIFELAPENVLLWPRKKIMAVADIHLGKAEAFRQNGIWLPGSSNSMDLERLSGLVSKYQVQEIVFLGDFVHTVLAVSAELVGVFAEWRQRFPGKVTVLLGNHDRGLDQRWPRAWSDTVRADEMVVEGFTFQHEPPKEPGNTFVWAGHVHPVVNLSGGVDSLRLPCFLVAEHYGLLPAFSSLAGGFAVKPNKLQRVYAAAGSKVIELGRRAEEESA